jgi:hypothetical protein
MKIQVGPKHDRRFLNFILPQIPNFSNPILKKLYFKTNNVLINGDKIGCLVSGGIDSAILYFLLIEENINTGNKFQITPYTILRIGAETPARNVINWIHQYYGLPKTDLNIVGDPTLPQIEQVDSGFSQILGKEVDFIYMGIIADRPEHYVNWFKYEFKETFYFRYPLLHLEKSHVIDLFVQKNVLDLIRLTTSCNDGQLACGTCNGCTARRWGFEQLNIDPL